VFELIFTREFLVIALPPIKSDKKVLHLSLARYPVYFLDVLFLAFPFAKLF